MSINILVKRRLCNLISVIFNTVKKQMSNSVYSCFGLVWVWVFFHFMPLFPQNASAWRCFNFSKQPVLLTSEAAQVAPGSSPSVMNHVMHASHGEVHRVNIHYLNNLIQSFWNVEKLEGCAVQGQYLLNIKFRLLFSMTINEWLFLSESRELHGLDSFQGSSEIHGFFR